MVKNGEEKLVKFLRIIKNLKDMGEYDPYRGVGEITPPDFSNSTKAEAINWFLTGGFILILAPLAFLALSHKSLFLAIIAGLAVVAFASLFFFIGIKIWKHIKRHHKKHEKFNFRRY